MLGLVVSISTPFLGHGIGIIPAPGSFAASAFSVPPSEPHWKTFVNKPKTRASANSVPVIRQLAEILDDYRKSIGNPATGVMLHNGSGTHMDFDKLAQRIIRPAIEKLGLEWYGWHGFRRGVASNLYELGADEKIVQRVLRHAKAHVTKDRYIKAFDPAVLAAMKKMETTLDAINVCAPTVHHIN